MAESSSFNNVTRQIAQEDILNCSIILNNWRPLYNKTVPDFVTASLAEEIVLFHSQFLRQDSILDALGTSIPIRRN